MRVVLEKWGDKILNTFKFLSEINKISVYNIGEEGLKVLATNENLEVYELYINKEQELYKPIIDELDRVLEVNTNIANQWNKATSNIGDDFLSNLTKAEDKYKSEIEELKAKLEAKDAEIATIKNSKSNLQEFHDIVNENNLMRELLKAVL